MTYSTSILLKRVLRMVRPFWKYLIVLFFFSFLSTPLAVLTPIPLKLIIDNAFGYQAMPEGLKFFFPHDFNFSVGTVITTAVAMVVVIEILKQLQGLVSWLLQTYTGEKIVVNFRALLFNQVQKLSLAYHDHHGTADALYKLQNDASAIRTIVVSGFTPFISAGLTLIGMLIVMTYIHWHFTVIAITIIPILLWLTHRSSSRLRDTWGEVKKYESSAMAVIHETLASLRVVKAFGQESKEEKRFITRSNEAIKGQMKVARLGARFDFLVGMTISIATALLLYIGATYVQSGKITLGELIIVMAYLAQVFGPLVTISKNITSLQSSLASIERVFALLDHDQEVIEHPNLVPVSRLPGVIEFDHVYFSYNKSKNTLSDISFKIEPGMLVGILGSTGAGKSTLINLLMRFYDVDKGRIMVHGINIKKYKVREYRSLFSLVLQESILFSTSIGENIAYGKTDASEKEIMDAAKAANAHDFIMGLERGYNTEVGERGMQLSGGERQRIAIARAFLTNAPILILDEPTSSVDIGTEAAIMDALERLMAGRTTLLITHRLDTLEQCDALIRLANGRMVEFVDNSSPATITRMKNLFKNKVV
jgi:ATP-binding cassette, subfamily B, bacterial